MWVIYTIFFLMNLTKSLCYINKYLFNSIDPLKLRKILNEQLNLNYKYLPYNRAKSILHQEVDIIDIYGDNSLEKNVEHVFPQYYFKTSENKNMMKSDLHNLYLCNTKLNTLRQNFKYISHEEYVDNKNDNIVDQIGDNLSVKELFEKKGYLMVTNKKNRIFIPTLYSRGMISRSLAYFSVKYDYVDKLKEVIDINTLLQWNIDNPVTSEEYHKNIVCYNHQNNLNPFILDPDLMLYTFSDNVDIESILKKKKEKTLDPFYSIDTMMKKINDLEKEKTSIQREKNRLNKKIDKTNK